MERKLTLLNQIEREKKRKNEQSYCTLEATSRCCESDSSSGIQIMAPGALHRSRWMAKAIYSLKIWLYRHQFKLTSRKEFGLKNICMFVVSVYVKAWFLSTSAPKAPSQDLKFLKQLEEYKTRNEEVSRVSVKKFLGHLWYLSEELVALAFFDQTLPFNTKEKTVNALKKINFEHPIKRAVVIPIISSTANWKTLFLLTHFAFFKVFDLSQLS